LLKQRLDQIDKDNKTTHRRLDAIMADLHGSLKSQVAPELEAAILRTAVRADTIDRKVPDKK
jgi:hypothetical protein